jgi:hypothetical protein
MRGRPCVDHESRLLPVLKRVIAFAVEGDLGDRGIRSNTFESRRKVEGSVVSPRSIAPSGSTCHLHLQIFSKASGFSTSSPNSSTNLGRGGRRDRNLQTPAVHRCARTRVPAGPCRPATRSEAEPPGCGSSFRSSPVSGTVRWPNGLPSRHATRSSPYLASSNRLRECTPLVNAVEDRTIRDILGNPDDLKFRSSMTSFGAVSSDPEFAAAISKFYGGKPDPMTLDLLAR